jgi:arginine decarboxylase
MVYATESTHKLLAGLSQASQILVQDSEQAKLDEFRFNEAFLMHTSTRPSTPLLPLVMWPLR